MNDDFELLVRENQGRLLRFVNRYIHDEDAAASIVQDCFLKAYTARTSFRGECAESTWLASIALNLVRDRQRTKKIQFWSFVDKDAHAGTESLGTVPSPTASPEDIVATKERLRMLLKALQALPVEQRIAVELRFWYGMNVNEIASATGQRLNTVRARLQRALVKLRTTGPSRSPRPDRPARIPL